VARAVVDHQPIGIMKLSELLALPSHRIRYSLHVLEQMGYIRASPDGAVATPQASQLFADLEGGNRRPVGEDKTSICFPAVRFQFIYFFGLLAHQH
jgi:predicted transcriptional regulator